MSTDTLQATEIPTGTWTIDPSHSEVGFTVRHLMTKVRGQFEKFEGTITTTDDASGFRAEASIDLESVNTRDEKRDGHLRSPDFFDVEKHGPMTFRTTAFDGSTARGDLTIKGVTKPVELAVEFLGVQHNDLYDVTVLGYEASAEINRRDFGVDFNVPLEGGRVLVGDKVTVVLSIQAALTS